MNALIDAMTPMERFGHAVLALLCPERAVLRLRRLADA